MTNEEKPELIYLKRSPMSSPTVRYKQKAMMDGQFEDGRPLIDEVDLGEREDDSCGVGAHVMTRQGFFIRILRKQVEPHRDPWGRFLLALAL